MQIEQKRKKQRKDGRVAEGIPEDDPAKYKHAIYVMTMKVFFLSPTLICFTNIYSRVGRGNQVLR